MTRPLRFAIDHYLALPLGAGAALLWANVRAESYFRFAQALAFGVNGVGMAFFLALVTKEVVEATLPGGAMHTWRRAVLPIAGAVGGLIGSIAVYFSYLRLGDEASLLARGWPIAAATDIAFTYFVARTIFRRHPVIPFLLLLGIASDAIGMLVVELRDPIGDIHADGLALVAGAIALAIGFRAWRVHSFWPYLLVCGTLSWLGLYWSGLHPALALVPVMPFLTHAARDRGLFIEAPARARDAMSQFERTWKFPVQVVLLLFGLVNGGVLVHGFGTGTWASLAAALAGKPAGTLAALLIAVAAGLRLPYRVTWRDTIVVSLATSIGFSFALFFATSVFPAGPLLTEAKIGALLTVGAGLVTLAAARVLRVGRFGQPEIVSRTLIDRRRSLRPGSTPRRVSEVSYL
jgi:NhaA family Na+:H+ antiporter